MINFILFLFSGYEETYTISQLSPKSTIDHQLPQGIVLQTSQTENLEFNIEPSALPDDKYQGTDEIPIEDLINEEERERHVIVARSADNRESRSINTDEIPVSNNNEIDNELELHNKRKYYEIHPTKTIDYLRTRDDDEILMSEGFGDRLEFRFPGESKRVPKARALTSGPIRATAVQPIFATATLREQGRQNTEIQNIITGIVKLLNGNVNVQANSQLLRPGRPMNSRINNRGPPRISDVPPLPDFDKPMTPPPHVFHPTKTPPPYPFDRPPHHGVNLPEQIVPPMPHRPGFHRPIPPWQRPRPRPPNRRPNPGLPMYKPMPPLPPDLPDLEDSKPPEDIEDISENESHSENNIHHDTDDNEPVVTQETNNTEVDKDEKPTTEETTTSTTTTTTTTTTEKPTTTTEKLTTTTEKPTTTTEKVTTTTEKPKTEKPVKPEKKKDSDKEKLKEKFKPEEKPLNKTVKNETVVETIIESSISETKATTMSIAVPTPTEGLITQAPTISVSSKSSEIVQTSINTQPLPSKCLQNISI